MSRKCSGNSTAQPSRFYQSREKKCAAGFFYLVDNGWT